MAILQPTDIYAKIVNVEVHLRYLSRPDRYDNLPNISISRRFPSKICINTY